MTENEQQAPEAPVGTVARTLRLLQELAQADDRVTVAGLAARIGLPSSTVHRLLQLLRTEGFVEADGSSRSYRPGPELLRVAALLAGKQDIGTISRPILERLVEACGETILLGVYLPSSRKMTFVEEVESPHALRFEIPCHVPLPVVWGCSGRVLLAHLPEEEARAALAEAEPSPVTGETIGDEEAFLERLREIRERGHDFTTGEKLASSIGIAAPVFGRDHNVVASLTVTLPTIRFSESDRPVLTKLVVDGAAELSNVFGYGARSEDVLAASRPD